LELLGTDGNYTLTDSGNSITTLAGDTGTVNYSQDGSLTIGTVNSTSGITATTNTVLVQTTGGVSDITLDIAVSANGTGDAIVLAAGRNFINNIGASELGAPNGRYLIYSTDPANDTRGELTYNFKQYDATYGVTVVEGTTGNGFLYSVAPTITPGLTGTVTKTYDGDATAALASGNYSVSGAIDSDIVTLNNPASGTYDNKNVGAGKTVDVSGLSIVSAVNGAATVYGYTLSSDTASGAIGNITAKALTLASLTANNKVYDGATTATISSYGALSGIVSGDTVTLNSGSASSAFDNKNAGTGKTVTASSLALDNTNYSIANQTTTADITAKALTIAGTGAANKIYDGSTTATVTAGTLSGFVVPETLGVSGSGTFDTINVGTGKNIAAIYTLADGTNGGLAGNYSLSGETLTANITANTTTTTTPVLDMYEIMDTENITDIKNFNDTIVLAGTSDAEVFTARAVNYEVEQTVFGYQPPEEDTFSVEDEDKKIERESKR
ncbi:MAG: YDG domain-containing protein, partial [Desulfobacterales bacterium]|nr:YDG domain-containing protein [Desulfobacterales bacterium]